MRHLLAASAAALSLAAAALAQEGSQDEERYLLSLYEHLHANPELSFQETETAKRLAEEMRVAGFEVTEGVGGTGVVGVMRNGDGPTLMLRADMDGLPVEEQTGLPYASQATGQDRNGQTFPTMHACGHDVHMTSLVGAARRLSGDKDAWSGTLVLIGQPAEELGLGAVAMLEDGLYERFPEAGHGAGAARQRVPARRLRGLHARLRARQRGQRRHPVCAAWAVTAPTPRRRWTPS